MTFSSTLFALRTPGRGSLHLTLGFVALSPRIHVACLPKEALQRTSLCEVDSTSERSVSCAAAPRPSA